MSIQPYQRVFHWVRLAYEDGPACRLTVADVRQACRADRRVCSQVLDDLVRARLLVRLSGGAYGRRPSTPSST